MRRSGMTCPDSLSDCRRQFNDAKNEYDRVQGAFLKELEKIKQTARDRQMTEFLENFSIAKVKHSGIHNSLIVNLKSHGIETAADIVRDAVLGVRGFGEKRTDTLINWRRQMELKFVFDPSRQISQQDRDGARLKFSAEFHKSETFFKRATEQLRLAYESAKQRVLAVERELAVVNGSLGQSRADVLEKP